MSIINNLPQPQPHLFHKLEHIYIATSATKWTHTFSRDYNFVLIFGVQTDSDNNADNYLKVFDTDKGNQVNGTGSNSQRNMIDDMWVPFKLTKDGVAAGTNFTYDIDKNTLNVAGGNNPYNFTRVCYKENVKKGDVIYGYSGHRCTFWIIGIDYGTSFSDMRTILWTNGDTGSDFTNQTITLDSGARNFDTIRIYYKLVKGAPETIYMDYQVSNLTSDADSGRMAIMTYTNSKNYVRSICFNGTNYDKLIIDSATVVGASGTDNSLLIPTYVAGIR